MSDLNTRMPSGSDVTQRTDEQPAFSADLLELFLKPSNLVSAWKQVRANKGAAGIDGMTIDDFPAWANAGNWKRVMTELRSGQYQPSPVKRVEIDKPDGGKRQLGIPTIVDRVIQQAIAQVLTPIFDPTFSDNSFGFRPNRNGQQAVKQVISIIKTGRRFAVDVDLSKFFDRVNHDSLMTYLGHKLRFTTLNETPCAEPHAGCCGGWRLDTSGYPIRLIVSKQARRPKLFASFCNNLKIMNVV